MPKVTQLVRNRLNAVRLCFCPQPTPDTLAHQAQAPEAYLPGVGLGVREGCHGSIHSLDSWGL